MPYCTHVVGTAVVEDLKQLPMAISQLLDSGYRIEHVMPVASPLHRQSVKYHVYASKLALIPQQPEAAEAPADPVGVVDPAEPVLADMPVAGE